MKRFFKFTIPSIMSMWAYALYTMVDGFFVANYVGEVQFAAVNLSMPIVTSFFAIGMLLSVGAQARVGYNLGLGNRDKANKIFTTAFVTLLGVGIIFSIILMLFLDKILYILGADNMTYQYAKEYLSVIVPFGLFFMTTYQFETLVKVDGFPIVTAISVFVAAITNILLDYVFIVPLKMGVYGAALATGIAQLVSTIMLLTHFLRKKGRLKFSKTVDFSYLKRIIPLGVGEAVNEVAIGYTVFLFNTTLLKMIGPDGLIIYAVISYISIFAQVTMAGIAQGLAPIFSVDYGRKDYKSISRTILAGFSFIFIISIIFKIIGTFFSEPIVKLFLEEGSSVKYKTMEALGMYATSYLFVGINVMLVTLFASLGKSKCAISVSLMRTPIFITIVMWIYENFIGGKFIWNVITISEGITSIIGIILLYNVILKLLRVKREKIA